MKKDGKFNKLGSFLRKRQRCRVINNFVRVCVLKTLTNTTECTNLNMHLKNSGVGVGSPNISGAAAMRRQAHGFFYALHIMVGGVLGGRKACRTQSPVYQPDTSSTALSLVAPAGGLNLQLWSHQ